VRVSQSPNTPPTSPTIAAAVACVAAAMCGISGVISREGAEFSLGNRHLKYRYMM
jgi:hypothetical protein